MTLLITEKNADEMVAMHARRLGGKVLYGEAGCRESTNDLKGLGGFDPSFPSLPTIPRDKWLEIIRANKGYFLGDTTRKLLSPHDQGGTNFCWGHGSVRTLEALAVYHYGRVTRYSAESLCVPITGGLNRGGSVEEALHGITINGCCTQDLWPENSLFESQAKQGWRADALNHRVVKFFTPTTFAEQMTLAFYRIPVAIGLRWWKHLVCQLDPVYLDDIPELDSFDRPTGQFGIGFDNSWGPEFGDNGYAYLDEEHALATLGGFAPTVAQLMEFAKVGIYTSHDQRQNS